MRILLYSHPFWPSLGGIERVSQLLAEALSARGHSIDLVTATPSADQAWDQAQPYRIWRRPPLPLLFSLVARAHIVHGNGASFGAVLPALLLGRPALWTHQAYQLLAIDGLGWADGSPTPLLPASSIAFYRSRLPPLTWVRQGLLLRLRRWLATRLHANVAISHWVAKRQPLPRQRVIPNPVELAPYPWSPSTERPVPILFLGRLVSEKGLEVLLHALVHLSSHPQPLHPTVLVVGDGPMRDPWQRLSQQLGLASQVRFLGALSGEPLLAALNQARIGVVPSTWEEPMGLVAVELIAAGLIPVVAERGGLAENIGTIGSTFPNGDSASLATVLRTLLNHPRPFPMDQAKALVATFQPQAIAARYEALYLDLVPDRLSP
ncbi:MAG: glycosyltransferase family 4 protein [Cyanobacteriota bacterium]|nr:glycosyltransferase family 4 protein [Cyanobacteriota bacterium]